MLAAEQEIKMSPKQTSAAKDLRLETENSIFVDPATGHAIRVTTHTRGILTRQIRHYAWDQMRACQLNQREIGNGGASRRTQRRIGGLGLPSDRIHYWTRVGDEPWRPQRPADLSQTY